MDSRGAVRSMRGQRRSESVAGCGQGTRQRYLGCLRSFLICLALAACPSGATAQDEASPENDVATLPVPLQQALDREGVPPTSLSVVVQAVDAPQPFLELYPDQPRNPASVMKLVTALVGMEVLGPGYRWRTGVFVDGPVGAGRLQGDLYLQGGGDPFLTTENFWKLLRRVREHGIHAIEGDLVVDNGYFAPTTADPGAFDEQPYRVYNAVPEALLVNFKATRFQFWPDPESGRVEITLDPPSSVVSLDNRLKLVDGRCSWRRLSLGMHVGLEEGGSWVRFWGEYPATCGEYSLLRSVVHTPAHAAGVFRALWEEMGGRIAGELREGTVPSNAQRLFDWESEPLVELIRPMNKFSNNIMARSLLLTIGAEQLGAPGTVQKGRDVVQGWMRERGVSVTGLFVDNGAGLSREARITARTLNELLLYAYRTPLMPEFVSSLPLSGVDGTLRRRFQDGSLNGRMHMKTGMIDHVRAVAGYLSTRSGRVYSVVMLNNHPYVHTGSGTRIQDALLDWLEAR